MVLDPKDFKKSLCVKWKKERKNCQISYNFFDSKTNTVKNISFSELSIYLKKICRNKQIIVNGGHLIPNPRNYDEVGKNSLKTWIIACKIVKNLKYNKINAKLSLILNDVNLTVDSRKIIFDNCSKLPKPFICILKKNALDVEDCLLHCNFNGDLVFSEKKLSNRTRYLVRRKKTLNKQYEGTNYCHSSFISYFIDLNEQNVDISVLIFPTCSKDNIRQSIKLYLKLNDKLRNICYFDTSNCFL